MGKRNLWIITMIFVAFATSALTTSCTKLDDEWEVYMKTQIDQNDEKPGDDDTGNGGDDDINTNDDDDNDGNGDDNNGDGDDNNGENDDNGDGNNGDDGNGNNDDNNGGNDDNGDNDNGTTPGDQRETPSWLGAAMDAYYTRVIKSTAGQVRFEDMIIFRYQNGCVLAPNGVVNMNLIFAYNQQTANAQGVGLTHQNANSAYWTGSSWIPANLMLGNPWGYYALDGRKLEIYLNDAVARGLAENGAEMSPMPKNQSYKVENGKITISYTKNNIGPTVNASLFLW